MAMCEGSSGQIDEHAAIAIVNTIVKGVVENDAQPFFALSQQRKEAPRNPASTLCVANSEEVFEVLLKISLK